MIVFIGSNAPLEYCRKPWLESVGANELASGLVLADYACILCPPGQAGNANDICNDCAAGTFKDRAGYDSCEDCSYGLFSFKGQSGCCEVGHTFNNTSGGCEACSPGTRWASGACEPCGAGSYASDTGYVHMKSTK